MKGFDKSLRKQGVKLNEKCSASPLESRLISRKYTVIYMYERIIEGDGLRRGNRE